MSTRRSSDGDAATLPDEPDVPTGVGPAEPPLNSEKKSTPVYMLSSATTMNPPTPSPPMPSGMPPPPPPESPRLSSMFPRSPVLQRMRGSRGSKSSTGRARLAEQLG